MKTLLMTGLLAASLAASAAETPPPLVTEKGLAGDAKALCAALNRGEIALACAVRFDALPSVGAVTGLIDITADAGGVVTIRVPKARTSLEGDFVCRSRVKAKKGAWHHLAFTYSRLRDRAAFYLDGSLQYENDSCMLPEPGVGEPVVARDFRGAVRDFGVWDIALESDRLIPAAGAAHSRWDVRHAAALAALKARVDAHPQAKFGPVAVVTTDPTDQERVLDEALPEKADFSGAVEVFAARDEFEDASVVVTALEPVKAFTLELSDLTCGAERIPAKDVDIRLVKRWFRAGGAWHSYFVDFRFRVLTPHLLVHDDDLIRVDELRTRNLLRFDYPDGRRWVDVSDPHKGIDWNFENMPFRDADTLQPIRSLTAYGRNQQYFLTFHAKRDQKPGLYRGSLRLLADGKAVGALPVRFRVLDFALPPRGTSYDNASIRYQGQVNNQAGFCRGRTLAERAACAKAMMRTMRDHNQLDFSGAWKNADFAALAKEVGMIPDSMHISNDIGRWQDLFPGKQLAELTEDDLALATRFVARRNRTWFDYYNTNYPDADKFLLFYSESSSYLPLRIWQDEQARLVREKLSHAKVYAHSMGVWNWYFAGDIQDANVQTSLDRRDADRWHALGAPIYPYAKPFAAPENPAAQRRHLGLERWKFSHMDGNMQHGCLARVESWNEWSNSAGGDGSYRCQVMLYEQYGGFLETICWAGVREAFDDVRYLSLLKAKATPLLTSPSEPVRREARRALIWLEDLGGADEDMQDVRIAAVHRIGILDQLAKKEVR